MVQATLAQTVLNVPDITCGHCELVITAAIAPVDGVEGVAVDIRAKQVRVDHDPARVDVDRLTAILAEEEYSVASAASAGRAEASEEAVPVAGCSCCGSSS